MFEQATKRPWERGKHPLTTKDGWGENFSDGDWYVFPPEGEAGPVAIFGSEADATFAVEAVNNHERLTQQNDRLRAAVEACREVVALAERNVYPQPDKPQSDWAKVKRAKEALAQLDAAGGAHG